MKLSGKTSIMIILRVTKKAGFHSFSGKNISGKVTGGGGGQIDPHHPQSF